MFVDNEYDQAKVPSCNRSDLMSPLEVFKPFASHLSKYAKAQGRKGCGRCDVALPPLISIVRSPNRSVLLVPEFGDFPLQQSFRPSELDASKRAIWLKIRALNWASELP